jgi:hypothetical protein
MWNVVIAYSSFATNVEFLMTKQAIIHLDSYRIAFYVHISCSFILMVCGGLLFIHFNFPSWWKWHKRLGKVYVMLLLLGAAPSGIVMGYYANGGLLAQVNFIFLSIIWWVFTYFGYRKIIQKDIISHKKWMYRSFALTLSAITLRALQMLLPMSMFADQGARYVFISWSSWLINLMVVELYIYSKKQFVYSKNQTKYPIVYTG